MFLIPGNDILLSDSNSKADNENVNVLWRMTLEQQFNMFILPNLPQKLSDVDFEDNFKSLSVGNMLIEKQLRRMEERNAYLLMKWRRSSDKFDAKNSKSANFQDDQSCSDHESHNRLPSETSKNEGKILTPIPPEKKKRIRRTAGEIEFRFNCPVENCNKRYVSEGSLSQHIKLKHPVLFNSTETKKAMLASISAKSGSKGQGASGQMQKLDDFSRNSEQDDI